MGSMIRVGKRGDEFVLMLMGPEWPKTQIRLTPHQAADLSMQIDVLLPPEVLNVEPYSSDVLDAV